MSQAVAPEASFAELLSKARHHETEAVATLYRRALPVMYRYVYVHLGQPDLVEDVVSEVFLVMVESIEHPEPGAASGPGRTFSGGAER